MSTTQPELPAKTEEGRLASAFNALCARPLWLSYVLSLALGFGGLYLVHTYMILTQRSSNDELRESLRRIKSRNDAAEMVHANQEQFDEDFVRLYRISDQAHTLLPPKAEATKVLEGVQEIAKSLNLRVIRFSAARPPVATGRLFEIAVNAKINGKHRDLDQFLSRLSSHPRIIAVTGFNLTDDGNEQTLMVDLATYYAPPPGDLPPFPEDIVRQAQKN